MREEEEREPGCYRHIYFLHICREKARCGECRRLSEEGANSDED